MKKIIFLLAVCCLFSCATKTTPKKPEFLLGNWERINSKSKNKTYEVWQKDFTGIGATLKGNDTVFKEVLSIVTINDRLVYKVVGVNENPTLFKFTQQTDTSFVAENPTHDFPKKIEYRLENGLLKATVSAGKNKIDFVFKKTE